MKDPRDRSPDGTELRQAFQDLSTVERWAERVASGVQSHPYTAPESLEGPQLSVETRTENGMHTVAGIVEWPPGADTGLAVLDETERAVLRSLVRSLLDLAGHESGTARTRVVLTPSGRGSPPVSSTWNSRCRSVPAAVPGGGIGAGTDRERRSATSVVSGSGTPQNLTNTT